VRQPRRAKLIGAARNERCGPRLSALGERAHAARSPPSCRAARRRGRGQRPAGRLGCRTRRGARSLSWTRAR